MMRVKMKWVVLWSLWVTRLVRQPGATVWTASGWVRGTVAGAGTHISYFGIPYATVQPHRRFQAAIPKPTWEGVLDAINENIRCTQRFTNSIIMGQEDCLTLNVHTPIETSNTLLPVMVFIHGGGFRDGSGSPFLYGPEYLVRHGIILVTINYRLEILGFLCLGTNEAPGNVGLKDQVEAFKWVKKNIENFGGNPDNVNIFGISAGSSAVMYHLLSPMSKGLFSKAIMQSGSVLSPWSFQYDPLKPASLLAELMGHKTKDPKELYRIFMNKTAEDLLITRVPRNEGDVVLSENVFVPCVEEKIPGVDQFLSEHPYNLLSKGEFYKVPIIIGYNDAEGYMFFGKENATTIAKLNTYQALPRNLYFPIDDNKIQVANKLRELYIDDDTLTKDNSVKWARYEGDSGITFSVISTIDVLLKSNDTPIYTYKFCFDGWLNVVKHFSGFWFSPGASHADDIFYMFKPSFYLPHTYTEYGNILKITTMWTNFAKYGNPTPKATPLLPVTWQLTNASTPQLFVIDNTFSTEPLWKDEIMLFWNSTYAKYRRKK